MAAGGINRPSGRSRLIFCRSARSMRQIASMWSSASNVSMGLTDAGLASFTCATTGRPREYSTPRKWGNFRVMARAPPPQIDHASCCATRARGPHGDAGASQAACASADRQRLMSVRRLQRLATGLRAAHGGRDGDEGADGRPPPGVLERQGHRGQGDRRGAGGKKTTRSSKPVLPRRFRQAELSWRMALSGVRTHGVSREGGCPAGEDPGEDHISFPPSVGVRARADGCSRPAQDV